MLVSLFPEPLTGKSTSEDIRVLVRGVLVQADQVGEAGYAWFLVTDTQGLTRWRRSDTVALDEKPSGGWG